MSSTVFVRTLFSMDNGTRIRGIVQKKRGKGKASVEATCNNEE